MFSSLYWKTICHLSIGVSFVHVDLFLDCEPACDNIYLISADEAAVSE
jgi:hypothetical protein